LKALKLTEMIEMNPRPKEVSTISHPLFVSHRST